jgi:serine-type D-Ala-D-Ala carboxypeptidase/endopeptidase (penicillin-binding protein 4)
LRFWIIKENVVVGKFCRFFLNLGLALAMVSASLPSVAKNNHHHYHPAPHAKKKSIKKAARKNSQKAVTAAVPASPLDLQSGMDSILRKTSPRAHMGVIIQSVNNNQVIYQYNADNLFTPASVNKLFVAIASLDYLKPDYHFETRLRTDGPVDQGALKGNLYVQFNGDPTLTEKQFTVLLDQLKTLGIDKINGHVYLDNTAYGSAAYAPGWLLHDLIFGYAAPLNAVILNENRFAIILSPSNQNGKPAAVSTTVPAGVVRVENNTSTRAGRAGCPLSVYSDNDNMYHVNGCVAKQPGKQYFALALRDPVAYAKALITNELGKNNIAFDGMVQIQQAPASSTVLATHQSPPLNAIVREMLKESDNLYTNSILKQIGAVFYQTQGTWQNGLNAIKQILGKPAGIDFSETHLFDGSGLSRYNLVSPKQLAKLLEYAYTNPKIQADLWDALPISGQDGTLRGRLLAFSKDDAIHAKTGTMKNTGVSALAGYIKSHNHGLLIFVIMTNGLEDTHRAYKNTEDRICQFLLNAH